MPNVPEGNSCQDDLTDEAPDALADIFDTLLLGFIVTMGTCSDLFPELLKKSM